MNTYFKIKSYCLKGLEIVTCVALLGLLTVLLVQIVSRLLKCPVTGTMTYANMLLMWVAFPAACLGIDKKMQLGVDVLYNILPGGKKRAVGYCFWNVDRFVCCFGYVLRRQCYFSLFTEKQ